MIINVDRKTRSIQLSIKAKDNADQQEAMQRLAQSNERETAGTTSLGALLRAKLDNRRSALSLSRGRRCADARPYGCAHPNLPASRRRSLTPHAALAGDAMTRSDLVAQLAERFAQLTQRDTEFAVKTILDAMSDALARGHRIEIRGFGSFSINRRPPRVGRNPRSGEQVTIPEKLVPHFKPGKALREAVDAPAAGAHGARRASIATGSWPLHRVPRRLSVAATAP